jgi:hypothetical protein
VRSRHGWDDGHEDEPKFHDALRADEELLWRYEHSSAGVDIQRLMFLLPPEDELVADLADALDESGGVMETPMKWLVDEHGSAFANAHTRAVKAAGAAQRALWEEPDATEPGR